MPLPETLSSARVITPEAYCRVLRRLTAKVPVTEITGTFGSK
jgi:hypothetical protein